MMAIAPEHLDPHQPPRSTVQVNYVLSKVGYDEASIAQWWSDPQPELGGRTALQTWDRGEYDEVLSLVERLASRRFADALSNNPESVRRLLQTS